MRVPPFLGSLAIALGFVASAILFLGAFFAPLVRSFGFGGPQGTPYCVAGALLLVVSIAALVWRIRGNRGSASIDRPRAGRSTPGGSR